ncbi:carbohydrate-binding domain-containing protein [Siccirubricoccus deserti]
MEWGGGGVTEEVQAKFDLNLLLDAAKGGVARTYLYELLDNGLSPTTTIEGSLGLFHSDGTPKQAATAIHNLGVILEDSAANASSFTTSALDVSVDGLSDTGRTLLMQKADGSYSLAIWAEPDIWNEQSRTAISAPTQSVTITLGTAAGTITVYDPLTGTSAIASAKDADSITVEVTDHPLIIDIAGPSTAPVAESPAEEEPPVAQPPATQPPVVDAGGTVIGTGSDTLVLKISQDAWQGDAQYTVSVDGEQLGGTLTARALSGSGESDTVTLQGDWGLGGHEVSVSFINDAWGGSSSTDRDLHVDSVTYNGVAAGRATTLYGNGAAHFTVKDATGPDAAGSDATIGSGTDSIVLKIAQDAYDGDAQYVILVDGEQVGGTLTAGASHALGEHDTLTVKGSWAAGDHRLSVKFLNDAYDGTPRPTATSTSKASPTTARRWPAAPRRCWVRAPSTSPSPTSPHRRIAGCCDGHGPVHRPVQARARGPALTAPGRAEAGIAGTRAGAPGLPLRAIRGHAARQETARRETHGRKQYQDRGRHPAGCPPGQAEGRRPRRRRPGQ